MRNRAFQNPLHPVFGPKGQSNKEAARHQLTVHWVLCRSVDSSAYPEWEGLEGKAVGKGGDTFFCCMYTLLMTVADHLTLNKLRKRVKKTKDPVERTRFLGVHHAKRGLTAKEIARVTLHTLHTARWVQQVVQLNLLS